MTITADSAASNGRLRASGALAAGRDVIVWPGGERHAMRNWRKRDQAVLGGHDTVFLVSEGRFLAPWSGSLVRRLPGVTLPITLGVPLGVSLEILPTHIRLPAKIRTELLDPIEIKHEPERAGDVEYVDRIYLEVQAAIQAGMNRLATGRRFWGKGAQRCRA